MTYVISEYLCICRKICCNKMGRGYIVQHSHEAKLSSKKEQITRCNTSRMGIWWCWWQMFYRELNKKIIPPRETNERTNEGTNERKRDPTIKTQYANDFGYWQIFMVMYASIFLHTVNDWWYIITLHSLLRVCGCYSLSPLRNENI